MRIKSLEHDLKETKANYYCRTSDLVFYKIVKYEILLSLLNIFKNIKTLDICGISE